MAVLVTQDIRPPSDRRFRTPVFVGFPIRPVQGIEDGHERRPFRLELRGNALPDLHFLRRAGLRIPEGDDADAFVVLVVRGDLEGVRVLRQATGGGFGDPLLAGLGDDVIVLGVRFHRHGDGAACLGDLEGLLLHDHAQERVLGDGHLVRLPRLRVLEGDGALTGVVLVVRIDLEGVHVFRESAGGGFRDPALAGCVDGIGVVGVGLDLHRHRAAGRRDLERLLFHDHTQRRGLGDMDRSRRCGPVLAGARDREGRLAVVIGGVRLRLDGDGGGSGAAGGGAHGQPGRPVAGDGRLPVRRGGEGDGLALLAREGHGRFIQGDFGRDNLLRRRIRFRVRSRGRRRVLLGRAAEKAERQGQQRQRKAFHMHQG